MYQEKIGLQGSLQNTPGVVAVQREDDKISSVPVIGFSGCFDSTSAAEVYEYVSTHTLIDDVGIFDQIKGFMNIPIPQEETGKTTLVETGLSLLTEFNRQFNKAENGVDAVFASYAIQRGFLLIKIKQLVKTAGQSWDAWATIHIPYISQRTRIDNMRLASRPDCHHYLILGSERLLMLVRATEGKKGENPIGNFLEKYEIQFSADSRDQIKKFKQAVDTALNAESLEAVGVAVDKPIIAALTNYIPSMDKNLIRTAKAISDAGGDVNQYFWKLITNKGREADPFEANKAVVDFNSQSAKLIHVIKYIHKNEDLIETLDPKIIKDLWENLTALMASANIK